MQPVRARLQPTDAAAMLVTFLGTRGEIPISSRAHRRHSALAVSAGHGMVMVDCGADWAGRAVSLAPSAIVITHAHADHVGGLRDGSPCPVFATAETLKRIARYDLGETRVVEPHVPFDVESLSFEAFPVEHSVRAPAVGFRIADGPRSLFYVPDVLAIPGRADALRGADVYVGDGAAVTRSIVRTADGVRIGHASIREQLRWCAAESVVRAIFTHCGSEIVRADGRVVAARVRALGRAAGVEAAVARDGLRLDLGSRGVSAEAW